MTRILKLTSLRPYLLPQTNLLEQLPLRELADDGWAVVWNREVSRCDAWIVLDGLSATESTCCPRENTLFITAEPKAYKAYNPGWLAAFHRVISSQDRIGHPRLEHGHAPLPWFVKRSHEALGNSVPPPKTGALSTVCSSRHNMRGHRRRLSCLRTLQRRLPGKIEWYGRKIRFIEDKWEGVAPFYFSLAIENCREPHYWTEKISDCFLAHTVPLYDGAPNIAEYFPEGSYIAIDTEDPEGVVRTITGLLKDPAGIHRRMLPALEEARRRCLEKHSFGARLRSWCGEFKDGLPAEHVELNPEPGLAWWPGKVMKFRRRWLGTT